MDQIPIVALNCSAARWLGGNPPPPPQGFRGQKQDWARFPQSDITCVQCLMCSQGVPPHRVGPLAELPQDALILKVYGFI